MEDDLSKLEKEFLAVSSDTSANEVVNQMKQARLGCALVSMTENWSGFLLNVIC
jgi:hypothetical protein